MSSPCLGTGHQMCHLWCPLPSKTKTGGPCVVDGGHRPHGTPASPWSSSPTPRAASLVSAPARARPRPGPVQAASGAPIGLHGQQPSPPVTSCVGKAPGQDCDAWGKPTALAPAGRTWAVTSPPGWTPGVKQRGGVGGGLLWVSAGKPRPREPSAPGRAFCFPPPGKSCPGSTWGTWVYRVPQQPQLGRLRGKGPHPILLDLRAEPGLVKVSGR